MPLRQVIATIAICAAPLAVYWFARAFANTDPGDE